MQRQDAPTQSAHGDASEDTSSNGSVAVRQSRPLPFQNFRNFRRLPANKRNLFMAAVAAYYHGTLANQKPWRTAVKYGKRWFFRVPTEIVYMVWHHSRRTKALYGKSVTAQIAEIMRLYAVNGIGADDYYQGGLASVDRAAHDQMVPYWMYRDALLFCLKVEPSHESIERIRSKSALSDFVRASGQKAPETIAYLDPTDPEFGNQKTPLERSFFVKPDRGSQGQDAERWVLEDDHFVLASRNRAVPKQEMIEYLLAKARQTGKAFVVQELIENSSAMQNWAGNALATARIITSRPPGKPAVLGPAMLRIPGSRTSSVDNIALGGTGFHVDAATGILQLGYSAKGFGPADFARHSPVTGEEITDALVPNWADATAMVRQLHETINDIPVIGWDVGFSEAGPTVVEANMPTGINPPDQVKLGGFFTWTVADSMAECIAERLKETQAKGSRLLVGADRKSGL